MMAGVQMEGSADSGYGVRIAGFHCPVMEFGKRLEALKISLGSIQDIEQIEINGHIMLLAMNRESALIPSLKEVASFRREPHKFFQDLPKFLLSTKAQFIDRMVLSGSLGSISLTLIYRPVKDISA